MGENDMPIYECFEDFLAEYPGFPQAWRDYAAASIIAEDDSVYGFVFGYLLI